jgi:hypothetical protein
VTQKRRANYEVHRRKMKPCVPYIGREYSYPPDVAFYIFFSTNISTEYFKHAAHSPFFSSNTFYFIMLSFMVPVYYLHFTHRMC